MGVLASTLPALHPSAHLSRDCEGPFGARVGSVQGLCDCTPFIFLVSVPRDILVT